MLGKETVQYRNLYVGPNIGIRVHPNRVGSGKPKAWKAVAGRLNSS